MIIRTLLVRSSPPNDFGKQIDTHETGDLGEIFYLGVIHLALMTNSYKEI